MQRKIQVLKAPSDTGKKNKKRKTATSYGTSESFLHFAEPRMQ